MSTTNGTINPFGGDDTTSGSQAGLYKGIGVALAVASGTFIGSSFVFKKKGLLQSMEKSGGVAGEGYSYLRSTMWWTGMILMIVGELCNFVAYAFTQAILVTPLGALSVVISAVLSSFFLKERLSFQGKIGCLQCILGAIMIVLHAPEQSSADTTIEAFKNLVISVGFLVYAGLATAISAVLIFYCGPRWGKKNMLVYISVCSLIGSISVVFTQGLGAAIVHSITLKDNQFTNWFIYLVLGIVVVTLILEIVYLNKALNLFNTALVTPTYYVIFTTMTIVSSIVLYRGFDASPVDIVTCVLGFLGICSGVALLHNSKSQPESEGSAGLLDEEKNNEPKRRRSVFQMFENKNENLNEKHGLDDGSINSPHGADDPGAADLFAAPFSGISRYASTTKQSQTYKLHRQSSTDPNLASSPTLGSPISGNSGRGRPHSNTISIGNTTIGEEGYSREAMWSKGQYQHTFQSDLLDDTTSQVKFSPFTTQKHTSISSSHRAQNDLDPLSSFRMQINGGESDDREELVSHST
ncbi:DUF803-domain-containing protein [Backusella circina FSU 941]|nr:DUF803-domain-containing protein [Backusella circina FSU 941]